MFLKNAKKKDFAYYLRHGGRRQQQVATAAAAIAVGPFRPACQSTSTCLLDSEQRDAAVRIAKKKTGGLAERKPERGHMAQDENR